MKWIVPGLVLLFAAACAKPAPEVSAPAKPAPAEPAAASTAPHGGTTVEIGDYHIEFVLSQDRGLMEAYILDDDLENFVRIQASTFEVAAASGGETETLQFTAGADQATGEVVGNTSYFTANSAWLKSHPKFDGTLAHLSVKGSDFDGVKFRFPTGHP